MLLFGGSIYAPLVAPGYCGTVCSDLTLCHIYSCQLINEPQNGMEYNPETDNNVIKWWFVMPEEK
jgi:hypothetical protein